MDIIQYGNTADAITDPHANRYWDESSLQNELTRTYEICHGCRMCFKYCPSFPDLFRTIDGPANGSVLGVKPEDTRRIVDQCFQCKLCYVNCPYTEQDGHAYRLDFPALMQRTLHVRARKEGVPLRDKIIQNADAAGKMNSGWIAALVNSTMQMGFHRRIMEALLGVHRNKLMPSFARTAFMRWFRKYRKTNPALVSADRVVLFRTCFVNYNNPDVGRAALKVLEKSKVQVECPEEHCCGMPGINSGDLKFALKKMMKNVKLLLPYARQGYMILAINPTCSLTLKKEYINFLPPGKWREDARKVAACVRDLHEYLFELKKAEKFNRDFKSSPGPVSYHAPCHLRAQNIGFRSRDLMKLIPGAELSFTAECCGHNGTWAMKKENFEASLQIGEKAFQGLAGSKGSEASVATDCPLAAIQIEQGAGLKERPLHPVQVLAKAYLAPEEGGYRTLAEGPQ